MLAVMDDHIERRPREVRTSAFVPYCLAHEPPVKMVRNSTKVKMFFTCPECGRTHQEPIVDFRPAR